MYTLTSGLIIYRQIGRDSILFRLANIFRWLEQGESDRVALCAATLDEVNRLLDLSTRYGFNGNLWHNYLAFLLATTETPFTLVCEKHGAGEGSVNTLVENDLAIFRELLNFDFGKLERELGMNVFGILTDYKATPKKETIYNKSVSEKVRELAAALTAATDVADMFRVVTDFYRRYGVGMLGLNKAFRLNPHLEANADDTELLTPITTTGDMMLSDLVGYDSQKARLRENTAAFVAGRKANNVLLYGDAGTGKSTSIKAVLNEFYDQGLRMIEVYKHEFKYLSRIIAAVKNRNYRFIIYMDDLSFEDFEIEYKYLKAVIEGGLEVKPDNVLIYATSNRRHIIKETWNDRPDAVEEDMHQTDTVQEKLSLAERFGLNIGFFRPDQTEYFNIVKELARRHPAIKLSEEELLAGARRFEMNHAGRSGRTAEQYINSLLGKFADEAAAL